MPSFLFTRRVTQAVQIAQLITHVAAIRARENNSGRYQCFFNRFNPVWCGLKNLSYQTNQKRFFCQQNTKQLNEPNQPETVDPNRTRLKPPTQTFFGLLAQFSRGERFSVTSPKNVCSGC